MTRAEELHDPVVIVGGNRRLEMELLRALSVAAGAGAWLTGPSEHYAHTPRFPKRQQRKRGPYKARVHCAQPDNRDDKYLHAAARRRRAALLAREEAEHGR